MSRKSKAITDLIESLDGRDLDPHYLGYFECFNRQLFFEAHDVLEELWRTQKDGPNYAFYKGLIQLAGAFVHLGKNRLGPATALFRLAEGNLNAYPPTHENLNVEQVLKQIRGWRSEVEVCGINPLNQGELPRLAISD